MHVTIELFVVFVFAIVLLIGAATRSFSRLVGIPFTILMLTLGALAGLFIRHFTGEHGLFMYLHGAGADQVLISPELILFIFLPMLIFESAFSLDAHVFKRSLFKILMLAGPALVIAALITAYFMQWLTPTEWGWSLSYALLFGALINATDPVAVVALLRELGISKRLVTLIEGESLLNDGTAIVLFTVFLGMATSSGADITWLGVLWKFTKVVLGGIAVGWILAQIISRWIGRVFNDPLVEITLMMALAYLSMIVAEGFLHVSGVMALVVAGLYMSSIGKTRISPEVMHFLHEFWEMMAYMANSLIFFLVGLVITLQIQSVTLLEIGIAIAAYLGIMTIRFCLIFSFRPLFAGFKHPVSRSDAMIASWGGLRGAVSLALALMLSQTQALDAAFRQQALLITAVIVLLTVVFNGATMKTLLAWLGLDKASLASQVTENLTRASVLGKVKHRVDTLSSTEEYRNVYWRDVQTELNASYEGTIAHCEALQAEAERMSATEFEAEIWIRSLNIERKAYWDLFSKGTLSRDALSVLNHELDLQVDDLKQGIIDPPSQRAPLPSRWQIALHGFIRKHDVLQERLSFMIFSHIRLLFNFYHAESHAADKVLKALHALQGMPENIEIKIRNRYTQYHENAKERLEEMRSDLPELTQAIETYFARRIMLNTEREEFSRLLKQGVIDEGIAKENLESVESRMSDLRDLSQFMSLPTVDELLTEVDFFSFCSDQERQELAKVFAEHVVVKGDVLFKEGDKSDSMYIVVRGALAIEKVMDNKAQRLALLGGGDIVGEMALLSHQPRMASACAATTVTLLRITAKDFQQLVSQYPSLLEHTWHAFGKRQLENRATVLPIINTFDEAQLRALLNDSSLLVLPERESHEFDQTYSNAYLFAGTINDGGSSIPAPSLIRCQGQSIDAEADARLLLLKL